MKRLIISLLSLLAIASMTAQAAREYHPQPFDNYEYVFVNDKNETLNKRWDIFFHDYLLRSWLEGDKVIGDEIFANESEVEKELFEYTNDSNVPIIFDYSMQAGDTLNVVFGRLFPNANKVPGFYHLLYKHIEVQSIESVTYHGVERLCYNLKTNCYQAVVELGYTTPETEEPREEDYYERISEMVELASFDEQWIEGVGYTTYLEKYLEMNKDDLLIYTLQKLTVNDETIYSAEEEPSHQYIPFVQEGKAWVDFDYQENYVQVGISGTTTIDGKEYYNLYREGFNLITFNQTGVSDSKLHGYIREENKRVYVRELNNEQEFLIYDFGAQIGDTIDWATITYDWSDNFSCKRYAVIDSIKPHTYYGKERNVYYVTFIEKKFNYVDGESMETGIWMSSNEYWIEGVGSIQTPIMSLLDDMYRFGASGMTWFKYFYDYNTQEIFPETTRFGAFSYPGPEPRKYLPQPSDKFEYIYVNDSNDTIIKKDGPYAFLPLLASKIIDGVVVSTSIPEKECEIETELFQFTDDKYVIFDYALQVGDTLNVILEGIGCACIGNTTTYWVYYKHIEVESIDTIVHNGIERLRYNLKSKLYEASIEYGYTTPNGEQPREEDYFERILEPVELGSLEEQWIEGVGYTTNIENIYNDNPEIYTLQCVFEKGENIYTAEGANCDGLSDNLNHKIDFTTLTLHRNGDVLIAVFPTAGAGEVLTLYDAAGRVVAVQPIRKGATTTSINVANLPKGVYIARLNSGASAKVAL